ncbi:GNAT family N-acetyltransferase [Thermoflavimicrobium dichotomicum]|uniref:Acetyltransferase (GNAT) family protein n=1 Tax=Thermoflavimicrobium dichotomicum TaxID=46223 RepID=A0A1I3LEE0_9BACL|nr:GNAT family N-acetyltransferase [Thermoflavimicrobium dichotomicum]SFI83139.1 Acetyltransferase (GNAT) family protein [Thermoflavimicrobium dichotomicum]
MNLHMLKKQDLERLRPALLRLIRFAGDGRITHRAIRWLNRLQLTDDKPGTVIAISFDQKKCTGLIAFGHYGLEESFIVVHPQYRKRGVGEALVKFVLSHLDKVYTRVACDNIPSLKLCFACGLTAFQLTKGPTGKPTLWLGGGNWKRQDLDLAMKNLSSINNNPSSL